MYLFIRSLTMYCMIIYLLIFLNIGYLLSTFLISTNLVGKKVFYYFVGIWLKIYVRVIFHMLIYIFMSLYLFLLLIIFHWRVSWVLRILLCCIGTYIFSCFFFNFTCLVCYIEVLHFYVHKCLNSILYDIWILFPT